MGSPSHTEASVTSTVRTGGATPLKASRNVLNVVLGDIMFPTWYPSFYPEELVGKDTDRLYVCQWCFKYSKEVVPFLTHVVSLRTPNSLEVGSVTFPCQKACNKEDNEPPGRLIYRKAPYSIYEIDGEEEKLFTQNLSLFAKLFLDNKSVFFDVSSFNYYLLIKDLPASSSPSRQIVGFFSKEKMSWDNNNLACILVFPPWQRQGLGKILMGVSYELSKREGRIGGPEKPLSELGRKGYSKFWEARVASAILRTRNKSTVTPEEIARQCWMLVDDVILALKDMGILEERKKGAGFLLAKDKARNWIQVNNINLNPPVDESCFVEEWMQTSSGREPIRQQVP
ncbi:hypothetical protein MMC26_002152 [Xylographa opegraphella]|nr:hypothetical protein [Xylographa opegraphella]